MLKSAPDPSDPGEIQDVDLSTQRIRYTQKAEPAQDPRTGSYPLPEGTLDFFGMDPKKDQQPDDRSGWQRTKRGLGLFFNNVLPLSVGGGLAGLAAMSFNFLIYGFFSSLLGAGFGWTFLGVFMLSVIVAGVVYKKNPQAAAPVFIGLLMFLTAIQLMLYFTPVAPIFLVINAVVLGVVALVGGALLKLRSYRGPVQSKFLDRARAIHQKIQNDEVKPEQAEAPNWKHLKTAEARYFQFLFGGTSDAEDDHDKIPAAGAYDYFNELGARGRRERGSVMKGNEPHWVDAWAKRMKVDAVDLSMGVSTKGLTHPMSDEVRALDDLIRLAVATYPDLPNGKFLYRLSEDEAPAFHDANTIFTHLMGYTGTNEAPQVKMDEDGNKEIDAPNNAPGHLHPSGAVPCRRVMLTPKEQQTRVPLPSGYCFKKVEAREGAAAYAYTDEAITAENAPLADLWKRTCEALFPVGNASEAWGTADPEPSEEEGQDLQPAPTLTNENSPAPRSASPKPGVSKGEDEG